MFRFTAFFVLLVAFGVLLANLAPAGAAPHYHLHLLRRQRE